MKERETRPKQEIVEYNNQSKEREKKRPVSPGNSPPIFYNQLIACLVGFQRDEKFKATFDEYTIKMTLIEVLKKQLCSM